MPSQKTATTATTATQSVDNGEYNINNISQDRICAGEYMHVNGDSYILCIPHVSNETTKMDVARAVEQCILKMQSGEFNRQEIRDNHINMASQMRKNIINCIKYIFYLHNIEVDVSEYWEKQFFHKFIKNENYDYVFKILES